MPTRRLCCSIDADGFVDSGDARQPAKIIARLHTPQVVASYGEDYPDRMQYPQISYSTAKAPAHFAATPRSTRPAA